MPNAKAGASARLLLRPEQNTGQMPRPLPRLGQRPRLGLGAKAKATALWAGS